MKQKDNSKLFRIPILIYVVVIILTATDLVMALLGKRTITTFGFCAACTNNIVLSIGAIVVLLLLRKHFRLESSSELELEYPRLWVRAGVDLLATEDEKAIIASGNEAEILRVIAQIIEEKRFVAISSSYTNEDSTELAFAFKQQSRKETESSSHLPPN